MVYLDYNKKNFIFFPFLLAFLLFFLFMCLLLILYMEMNIKVLIVLIAFFFSFEIYCYFIFFNIKEKFMVILVFFLTGFMSKKTPWVDQNYKFRRFK